jgi:hypothetical protein
MPPFGKALLPPHGFGLAVPTHTFPFESTVGVYHAPPPFASPGWSQGRAIVSNRQRTRPVAASSAMIVPRPPGDAPVVLVTTRSPSTIGAIVIGWCAVVSLRSQSTRPERASSAKDATLVLP